MIAGGLKGIRQVLKKAGAIVTNGRRLPMYGCTGSDDAGSRDRCDDLHSQTDSHDRNPARPHLHCRGTDACSVRTEGTGGKDDPIRLKLLDPREVNSIGAVYHAAAACDLQAVNEVPGERIVIVQNQNPHRHDLRIGKAIYWRTFRGDRGGDEGLVSFDHTLPTRMD